MRATRLATRLAATALTLGLGTIGVIGVIGVVSAPAGAVVPVTTIPGPPTTVAPTTVPPTEPVTTATTLPPASTLPPVTTATTPPSTTKPMEASTTTTTTTAPTSKTSSGTPWGLIAVIAILLIAIVLVVLLFQRRKKQTALTQWQAMARPAVRDAQIARDNVLSGNAMSADAELRSSVSLQVDKAARALEQTARQAPEPDTAEVANAVATNLRGLAFAIEAERLLRQGQVPPTGEQLAQADEARRSRSAELNSSLAQLSARLTQGEPAHRTR